MKKFTANYLVTASGAFLKNGILVAGEDGTALEYFDTTGDLKETAQTSFHNGILIGGFTFIKTHDSVSFPETENPVKSFVFQSVSSLPQFSIQDLIDVGKQIQDHFPEMKIPQIMNEISEVLLTTAGFVKKNTPGIYLLIGCDLPQLRFTLKCRLKKIL